MCSLFSVEMVRYNWLLSAIYDLFQYYLEISTLPHSEILNACQTVHYHGKLIRRTEHKDGGFFSRQLIQLHYSLYENVDSFHISVKPVVDMGQLIHPNFLYKLSSNVGVPVLRYVSKET